MTTVSESWSLNLPKILDLDDADVVTLKADFGFAANFLTLNGQISIDCADIKKGGSSNIRAGMYLITLTLDDKRDQVKIPFSLFVIDPPLVVILPPAAAVEQTTNQASSSTNTNTE